MEATTLHGESASASWNADGLDSVASPVLKIDTFFMKLRKVLNRNDITELSGGPGNLMRATKTSSQRT